jgi:ribulose bisphosphate carboxylase small subunit
MDTREAIAAELHRSARRSYARRKVILKGLKDLYQEDLVEMIPYARVNKGFKYIMTIINCFSKVAFAVPLKSKTGKDVAQALEPILSKHKFTNFQTDFGKEFFNSHVNLLMDKYKINHYATYSDLKASIVERLNRTLKSKMWKTFTVKGSYEWLSILPKILKEYNNSVHRTIGMKPKDVRQKHVKEILARMYGKSKQSCKAKFKVNDKVRISKYKRTFQKGYLPNWTNEVFTVVLVKHTNPTTYLLQDSKGDILKGGFYEQELSKSKTGDVYLVEKVLRKKGNKVLVRWAGFDKTSDSWVDKRHIL